MIGENSLEQKGNEREKAIVAQHENLISLMKKERMNAARRAILCKPQDLHWQFEPEGLRLIFFLNSGSYATGLVRELIILNEEE